MDPKKIDITTLLSSKRDFQFFVPRYQRGYDWKGGDQVARLFEDIQECLKSDNNNLFLGTMIFDVSNEKDGRIEIIDGQQRLTTLIISLIACRNFIKANKGHTSFNGKEITLLTGVNSHISTSNALGEDSKLQLIASDTIRQVFDAICDEDWDGNFTFDIKVPKKNRNTLRKQINRVRPVYNVAMQKIEEFCGKSNPGKIRELLKQIYLQTAIIKIDITDKSEAFEIFERTNARGKDLEVADLLKNYIFLSKQHQSEEISERWDQIAEHAGSSMLRMLKFFYVSRKGSTSTRDLYKKITKYAREFDEMDDFLEELEEFATFYHTFYSNNKNDFSTLLHEEYDFNKTETVEIEIWRTIGALRYFGINQTTPLIFSALTCFYVSDANYRDFLTFLRFLEGCHFINNKVCSRIGNEVEKPYARFSKEFYNSENFAKTSSKFIDEMKEQIASASEFTEKFGEITYDGSGQPALIRYIFDRLLNEGVKDDRIQFFDYYALKNKKQSKYTVEHVLPQSKIKESNSSEANNYERIGNLFVLSNQINSAIGNKPFEEKIKLLKDPQKVKKSKIKHVPDYVKDFITKHEDIQSWDEDYVLNRIESLAKDTYQIMKGRYQY